MTYYDFVKDNMKVDECTYNKKYSSAGHTFCWNKEDSTYGEGLFWFYEGDGFIINIHDFYIKEELIQNSTYSMADYVSIYSSYIVSANGEKFSPYQTLTANSCLLYTSFERALACIAKPTIIIVKSTTGSAHQTAPAPNILGNISKDVYKRQHIHQHFS